MNNKVTQPRLVAMMSAATGRQKRQTEDFLRSFFSLISDALSEHQQVKVKGFGTFKVIEVEARKSVNVSTGDEHHIPAHHKIVFTPDRELANLVNAPFEMFETVELSDSMTDAEMAQIDKSSGTTVPVDTESGEELGEKLEEEFGIPEPCNPFGPDDPDAPEEAGVPIPDEPTESMSEYNLEEASAVRPLLESSHPESQLFDEEKLRIEATEDNEEISEDSGGEVIGEEREYQEEREYREEREHEERGHMETRSNHRFGKGFLVGFLSALVAMVIGFILLWFFLTKRIDKLLAYEPVVAQQVETAMTAVVNETPVESLPEILPSEESSEQTQEKEKLSVPATQASDVQVIDTITLSRYLTTMARDHYGNFNLWPYIYQENEKKLGDPDRIRPGTPVVIPDLKKYGINPKNPEDIKKARVLGQKIYSRYRK